ncbi:MAG TPA: hypothetical protein VFA71_06230 [Terriglobales bacterium]|nr:hypothetical protein [Terriglobales bacterium]
MPLSQAVCYTATVDNCPSHQLGVTIPPLNATVAISTPTNWKNGTIFLHGGGNGEDYFDAKPGTGMSVSYANQYYNAGFQVVQIAWAGDWSNNSNNPAVKVMKYDACRPATILNYVYTNVHGGATSGAMCAQGHSAGSAAMAYALSWYGASSYLNNVVLTSGPVYANIEGGCQYPYSSQFQNPITVCPSGQLGCIGSSWTDFVQYLNDGTSKTVAQNTNQPPGNCNNYNGSGTATTSYDQNWHAMSIVASGANYSYPNTSLSAFLCATGQSQNNSAGQGQLFYKNFTSISQTLNYAVYRVDGCGGSEKIWDGTTSDGSSAFTVSADAMINRCNKPVSGQP